MKIEEGKIIEITEEDLFQYYLSREFDDVYDFVTYKRLFEENGTKIIN